MFGFYVLIKITLYHAWKMFKPRLSSTCTFIMFFDTLAGKNNFVIHYFFQEKRLPGFEKTLCAMQREKIEKNIINYLQ